MQRCPSTYIYTSCRQNSPRGVPFWHWRIKGNGLGRIYILRRPRTHSHNDDATERERKKECGAPKLSAPIYKCILEREKPRDAVGKKRRKRRHERERGRERWKIERDSVLCERERGREGRGMTTLKIYRARRSVFWARCQSRVLFFVAFSKESIFRRPEQGDALVLENFNVISVEGPTLLIYGFEYGIALYEKIYIICEYWGFFCCL